MEHIPLDECKDGYTYRIISRNLEYGVFKQSTGGFIGIREKIGSRFLFEEFHWDLGADMCGTVRPQEIIEKCPVKDIDASLGSECYDCKVDIKFGGPKDTGGKGWYGCKCEHPRAVSKFNRKLFNYLEKFEKGEKE